MARKLDTISKKSKEIVRKPLTDETPAASETPSPEPIKTEAAASEAPVESTPNPTPQPEEKVETPPVEEQTKSEDEPAESPEASKRETPTQEPADKEVTPDTANTEELTPPEQTPPGDDKFENLFPEPSIVVSGPPSWIWWILLVVASVVLGYLFFDLTKGRIDSLLNLDTSPSPTTTETTSPAPSTESPTATASPSATPTDTPSPTVSASSITLRVLNGTTVTGAAATAKQKLEQQGLTVRTIGNAADRSVATTTIYYQNGRDAEATAVKNALGNESAIMEQSDLANPDMVLVVIGKN